MRGLGTQQLEHFVSLRFPAARIARMDLDTTSTKWSHHRILERVARGEVDVLLGTQMIAKGLDFPGVTVVGVVDADTGLHLPDFRAGERTFQLVAQVAGRAGRGPAGRPRGGPDAGPGSPRAARGGGALGRGVCGGGAAAAAPPPIRRIRRTWGWCGSWRWVPRRRRPRRAPGGVADWLRRGSAERLGGALTVLGPAACPIPRLHGRWRWHVLVKAAEPRALGRVMRAWRAQGRARRSSRTGIRWRCCRAAVPLDVTLPLFALWSRLQ